MKGMYVKISYVSCGDTFHRYLKCSSFYSAMEYAEHRFGSNLVGICVIKRLPKGLYDGGIDWI